MLTPSASIRLGILTGWALPAQAIERQRKLVKDVTDHFGVRYLFRTEYGLYKFDNLCHQLTALANKVHGDESELDWVVSNLRRLSLPWGYRLHHAKAPKCPYGQNVCFTKDCGPCHKLVATQEHAPVIVATLEDLKKSRSIAREKGWDMYANDLSDQIGGMEKVLSDLEVPVETRQRNRGGQR